MKRFSFLFIILFICSCGRLTAVYPGDMMSGQEKKDYKGRLYVVSKKDETLAIAGVVNSPVSSHMRIRVELLMDNLGNDPQDFLFQEICASYKGVPLKVYSYSELVQEVYAYRNRQSIILKPGKLKDDDGSGIHQMMYDDRNYPPGNLNMASGRYFSEPSEESKMTIRNTESGFSQSEMFLDDFDLHKLHKESLQNRVIKKNSPYGGIVVVEHPNIKDEDKEGGILVFSVRIGEKTHIFHFKVLPIEKR